MEIVLVVAAAAALSAVGALKAARTLRRWRRWWRRHFGSPLILAGFYLFGAVSGMSLVSAIVH